MREELRRGRPAHRPPQVLPIKSLITRVGLFAMCVRCHPSSVEWTDPLALTKHTLRRGERGLPAPLGRPPPAARAAATQPHRW